MCLNLGGEGFPETDRGEMSGDRSQGLGQLMGGDLTEVERPVAATCPESRAMMMHQGPFGSSTGRSPQGGLMVEGTYFTDLGCDLELFPTGSPRLRPIIEPLGERGTKRADPASLGQVKRVGGKTATLILGTEILYHAI